METITLSRKFILEEMLRQLHLPPPIYTIEILDDDSYGSKIKLLQYDNTRTNSINSTGDDCVTIRQTEEIAAQRMLNYLILFYLQDIIDILIILFAYISLTNSWNAMMKRIKLFYNERQRPCIHFSQDICAFCFQYA